ELEVVLEQIDNDNAAKAANFPKPAKQEIIELKQASQKLANSLDWNEAETRARMIDVLLAQAGWNVNNEKQVSIEFPVTYEDGTKGRADYVLWNDNGQPLAILEAKRSSETDIQKGREQGRRYADALEHMGMQ